MKIALRSHRVSFFTVLLAIFLLIVAPVTSAKALGSGIPSDPYIVNNGCTVTVSFTAAVATTYNLELFDDLVLVYASSPVSATIGQQVAFSFTFPSIGKSVPGIGIYLYEGGTLVYSLDPFAAIDQNCNPCVDGVYQGVTTAWTQLYWGTADNKAVVPDTFIQPNKRLTIIDNPVPGWYRVAWACKSYYVKVGTLKTNYEKNSKPFLNGR